MNSSLAGRRILVTRAVHQAGKLSDGLRALGAEPVEVPVLEIQPPTSFEPLDAALRNLRNYDWIIFTSANTLRAVSERAATISVPLVQGNAKVAAVGRATAAAAEDLGFRVGFVPEKYVAEGLIAGLSQDVQLKRVLLIRASVARDVLPQELSKSGAIVDVIDAYRNVIPDGAPEHLQAALNDRVDAATFTSSSSVTHLSDVAKAAGIAFPFEGVKAVSIGPVTSATLREYLWEPAIEATPHDIPGLIAAVVAILNHS